jgi:hypothetical protein
MMIGQGTRKALGRDTLAAGAVEAVINKQSAWAMAVKATAYHVDPQRTGSMATDT